MSVISKLLSILIELVTSQANTVFFSAVLFLFRTAFFCYLKDVQLFHMRD